MFTVKMENIQGFEIIVDILTDDYETARSRALIWATKHHADKGAKTGNWMITYVEGR